MTVTVTLTAWFHFALTLTLTLTAAFRVDLDLDVDEFDHLYGLLPALVATLRSGCLESKRHMHFCPPSRAHPEARAVVRAPSQEEPSHPACAAALGAEGARGASRGGGKVKAKVEEL